MTVKKQRREPRKNFYVVSLTAYSGKLSKVVAGGLRTTARDEVEAMRDGEATAKTLWMESDGHVHHMVKILFSRPATGKHEEARKIIF